MPLHKVTNTLFYSKRDIMIRLCNSETVNGFYFKTGPALNGSGWPLRTEAVLEGLGMLFIGLKESLQL